MAKPGKQPQEETAMAAPAAQTTAIEVAESYGEDAGKGRENQGAADYKIPWLEIVQPGTPEVAEGKIKAGDIRNNVTGRIYDGKAGVIIVPCSTRRAYVEWVERNKKDDQNREGFQGQHDPTSAFVEKALAAARESGQKFGHFPVPGVANHVLVDTFYMPSMQLEPEDGLVPVMIAFKSTHIKAYQELQSKLLMVKVKVRDPDGVGVHDEEPPLYAHQVRMSTEYNFKNNNSWYTPVFNPAEGDSFKRLLLPAASPIFQAAKKYKKMFEGGAAAVDYSKQGGGGGAAAGDPEVPF